jgi:hypothetical protein
LTGRPHFAPFFNGKPIALRQASVEKKDTVPAQVVSVCPACGLFIMTGPHGTSEECIQALEAEVKRLTEVTERFKNSATQAKSGPRGKR